MRRVFILPILLLLALIAIIALLNSGSGLRLVARAVMPMVPGVITVERIEGRLIGPIKFGNLHWAHQQRVLTIDDASLDWRPARLSSSILFVDWLTATGIHWSDASVPSAAEPATPTELVEALFPGLPLAISANAIQLNQIVFQRDTQQLLIDQIALSAELNNKDYRISEFKFESKELTVFGGLTLGGQSPHRLDSELSWDMQLQHKTLSGTVHTQGDTDQLNLMFTTSGAIDSQLEAVAENLLDKPFLKGQAEAAQIDPTLVGLKADTGSVAATADFAFANETATIQSIFRLPTISAKPLLLNAAAKLESEDLQLQQIVLSVQDHQSKLTGRGVVARDLSQLSLNLDWTDLKWPPGASTVASPEGRATLRGSMDNFALTGGGIVTSNYLQPLRFSFAGSGDKQQFKLDTLDLSPANSIVDAAFAASTDSIAAATNVSRAPQSAQLRATGVLRYAKDLNAELSLTGQGVNLSEWNSSLQGGLSFNGQLSGGKNTNGLHYSAAITNLNGTLREHKLSGSAAVDYVPGQWTLHNIDLNAGQAQAKANGVIGKNLDLQWALDIPDLALFLPNAAGTITSNGVARGSMTRPGVSGDLSVAAMRLRNIELERLQGQFEIDENTGGAARADFTANGVFISDRPLGDLSGKLAGTLSEHNITVDLVNPDYTLKTALNGGLHDHSWRGSLTALDINGARTGSWSIDGPAPVVLTKNRAQLNPVCLKQDAASLCGRSEVEANGTWMAHLELSQLPLAALTGVLAPGLVYEGTANGTFMLGSAAQSWTGEGELTLTQGRVLSSGGEENEVLVSYEKGQMRLKLDPQKLSSNLVFDLAESGQLSGQIIAPLSKDGPLSGDIQARISKLSLIPALVPQIGKIDGLLNMDLTVAGTRSQPQIIGSINLAATEIVIPDLGVTLFDTALSIQTQNNEIVFDGSSRSGDGTLNLKGGLLWSDSLPKGSLSLEGANFRTVDLAEVSLVTSPQLTVTVDGRAIDVDGEINIPTGTLAPLDLNTGVRISSDQIIVSQTNATAASNWQLTAKVKLSLSEQVYISGFGLKGRLRGEVLAIEKPLLPTTARGFLEVVDGRYRAYGQELDIQTGRLEFTGGQIDNPGLDLKASRSSGDIEAGVQVRGELQNPQLKLYSVPPMSDSQAMSYLITGRAIEDLDEVGQTAVSDAATSLALQGGSLLASSLGRGLGLDSVTFQDSGDTASTALVVGKHLSPRLFVSYGIGLFDAINTLRLRYHINSRLTLETESGTRTSADLLYSFER